MADEGVGLGDGEASCAATGADARPKQRFADIDVTESGDDLLVQQRDFDRAFLALQPRAQVRRTKVIRERFRAEVVQAVRFTDADQLHKPKSAGIIIGDGIGVFGRKNNVVVFGVGIVSVGELGELFAAQNKPPTHTEVHKQSFAGGEVGLQKFGPPRQAFNPLPFYAGRKIGREGKAQVWAVELHMRNDPSFEDGGEAPADRFNFGEFWDSGVLVKMISNGRAGD